MIHPMYVVASLSPDNQVWVDLRDFKANGMDGVAEGYNLYHEFARQKLRGMGVPALLVEVAQYSVQPAIEPEFQHDLISLRVELERDAQPAPPSAPVI